MIARFLYCTPSQVRRPCSGTVVVVRHCPMCVRTEILVSTSGGRSFGHALTCRMNTRSLAHARDTHELNALIKIAKRTPNRDATVAVVANVVRTCCVRACYVYLALFPHIAHLNVCDSTPHFASSSTVCVCMYDVTASIRSFVSLFVCRSVRLSDIAHASSAIFRPFHVCCLCTRTFAWHI